MVPKERKTIKEKKSSGTKDQVADFYRLKKPKFVKAIFA